LRYSFDTEDILEDEISKVSKMVEENELFTLA